MSYSYDYNPSYSQIPFIVWLISLATLVVSYASLWVMFKKAGKPGWAVLIPLYNTYVMSEIAFGNGLLCILFYIPYVNFIFSIVYIFKLAAVFNRSNFFALGLLFLPLIFFPMLAFSGNSYYSGPAVTDGMYITAGRTPSNYGQNYYNQTNNNPYNTDTYYGEGNNGFYGQNNIYGTNTYSKSNYDNNDYNAQSSSNSDYFYGQSDDSDKDYNQNNSN